MNAFDKMEFRARARFLRAYAYYWILQNQGPMILVGDQVLNTNETPDYYQAERSTYDECVDYIVGELDDIIDNKRLPLHFTSQADKDYGRATLAMCMGLKSRVLLLAASPQFNGNPAYAGVVNKDGKHLFATAKDPEKWKRAADAAKAIIDLGIFDLYKEYHSDGTLDLHVVPQRLSGELEQRGDDIFVPQQDHYEIESFIDGSIMTIADAPWPGLTPDLLSVMLVVATQAKGSVLIHQKMFESRLFFVDKLIDMGAQIILCDPHRAVVIGHDHNFRLRGGNMTSPDIRAGIALLIAALSAEGISRIHNIEQIDRGYQNIEQRLTA